MSPSMVLDTASIIALVSNVAATVGVVMFNKQVVRYGFMAMVFLSALHMITTYLGCVVMLRMKVFEYKDANFKTIFIMAMVISKLAGFFCGEI